jgi:ABC-type sugar transport system ATPase subunit
VVYVTHDQVEAMTMGHRIAIMSGGVLQQVAPPDEVYARPANTFVAGFIGNPPMNLLDGDVVDGATVRVDGAEVVLPDGLAAQVAAAGTTELVVGIRPEHLVVDPASPLRGTVAVVESLGHERHLVCRHAGGAMVTVRVGGAEEPDAAVHEVGDEIGLRISPEHVHAFDRASGERIGP